MINISQHDLAQRHNVNQVRQQGVTQSAGRKRRLFEPRSVIDSYRVPRIEQCDRYTVSSLLLRPPP